MVDNLLDRSLVDKVYVSVSSLASSSFNEKDLNKTDEIMKKLKHVTGNTPDILEYYQSIDHDICLASIDFAGIFSRSHLVKDLLEECPVIKKISIETFISDNEILLLDSQLLLSDNQLLEKFDYVHYTYGDLPTSTSSPPFALDLCPFSSNQIHEALKQLPRKKAPGVDHIQTEMLLPLLPTLVPQLLHLFRVCWQWSYTPLSWRVTQVVPIHKKGSKTDPGNFRPISLTSIFRNLFEKCLYPSLLEQSPTLDIAQDGFRESRSSLDQVQCLIEICSILRRNHNSFPKLAFLDIKSAYGKVNRSYVWRELQSHLCPALLGILKNLFDNVQIEILLDNRVSYRFSPVTGVLQGSILSPFLYSIYINRLPSILRQPLLLDNSFPGDIVSNLTPTINCLLYADDVLLITNPENLTALLHQCEVHSYSVDYRWNPLKCVIVALNSDAQTYQLYGTTIPKESSFSYLGIHIKLDGLLDYPAMIQHNINKTFLTMNQIAAIGLSSKGFPPLLACHFYSQMIRAQLDYGLAISPLTTKFIHQLDTFRNQCIGRIFGGHSRSSAQIMLHLVNLPSMRTRVAVLQAQYLFRSTNLPDDTLLAHLLPYIQTSTSRSHCCMILHELDYYFHDEYPPPPVDPGVKLLNWLSKELEALANQESCRFQVRFELDVELKNNDCPTLSSSLPRKMKLNAFENSVRDIIASKDFQEMVDSGSFRFKGITPGILDDLREDGFQPTFARMALVTRRVDLYILGYYEADGAETIVKVGTRQLSIARLVATPWASNIKNTSCHFDFLRHTVLLDVAFCLIQED
ncbi:hypothetical protein G6F56_002649 [Rhizopus delemar]|nr:hypothetical protein G6F56_002649 [Rhizopus delemar]